MKWKAAGPYGIISECGNYTISQAKAGKGWVFSAYYKSKDLVGRQECCDEAGDRAAASAEVKAACDGHAKGKQ